MIYVVYNKETTILARKSGKGKQWQTAEYTAKGPATRRQRQLGDEWAIAEKEHFHKEIEKQVTRRNLMSNKEYQEPINTPSYCSPASEAYWSM